MGAQRSGVRWRGSNTRAPGAGPRVAFAENLRGQGSGLSTRQAEGSTHAPENLAPPTAVIMVEKIWLGLHFDLVMGGLYGRNVGSNENGRTK